MVINDKALVSRMKDAYNGGGYTVLVRPKGSHAIISGFWAVDIDNNHVSREVLSLLALHMGRLPESGEAYKITKTKEGPNVQKVIYDVAESPLRKLEVDVMGCEGELELHKTNITFDSCNVWQRDRDWGVFLLNPEYEAIVRKSKDLEVYQVGNAMYAEGDVSKAYVMKVERDANDPHIKHLSQMKWTVQ